MHVHPNVPPPCKSPSPPLWSMCEATGTPEYIGKYGESLCRCIPCNCAQNGSSTVSTLSRLMLLYAFYPTCSSSASHIHRRKIIYYNSNHIPEEWCWISSILARRQSWFLVMPPPKPFWAFLWSLLRLLFPAWSWDCLHAYVYPEALAWTTSSLPLAWYVSHQHRFSGSILVIWNLTIIRYFLCFLRRQQA